jgi:hypothetical protein
MKPSAEYYIDVIDRHLATGKYDWCRETMTGIRATMVASGVVTPKQQQAVEHMILGRLKHDV